MRKTILWLLAMVFISVSAMAGTAPQIIRCGIDPVTIHPGEDFTIYADVADSDGFSDIREMWKNLTNTIGVMVKITDGDAEIQGKALDIDAEGFLIILTDKGERIQITGGDVSLRKM